MRRDYAKKYEKATDKKFLKNSKPVFPFPLDEEIKSQLKGLVRWRMKSETEIPYSKADDLNKLWITLIKKSIQCLRFFDTRELFQQDECDLEENSKRIGAYGIKSLEDYQASYAKFESMLYGSNEHYRDHVFHSVRVWLIGVFVLTREPDTEDKERLIDKLVLDGGAEDAGEINQFEWLSMWTIAALCHDLGYPLEKTGSILDTTKKMMSDFVPRPNVSDNFTFTGIQNAFNDHILKFMSTKLYKGNPQSSYSGRIQQKYYFKYVKSLEKNKHGIISAVIVFRKLLFFLESDFDLNNDSYSYEKEDARQFYIRREILRAMSSHTCDEIFHVKIQSLPALLFICDELQEWGRKSWGDLYAGTQPSEVQLAIEHFNVKTVEIIETTVEKSAPELSATMIERLEEKLIKEYRLYEKYKKTFRDGPGTTDTPSDGKRKFDFEKEITIEFPSKDASSKRFVVVEYEIPQNKQEQKEFRVRVDNDLRRKLGKPLTDKIKDSPYFDQLEILPPTQKG